jgi:DNA-binding beta-propeller fold protein YncE
MLISLYFTDLQVWSFQTRSSPMKTPLSHRILATCSSLLLLAPFAGCSAPSESGPRNEARGQYTFWPLAPAEPRVQFVKTYRSGFDLRGKTQSGFENLIFGEESEDVSAIEKPYGVEITDGRVYVCDIRRPALTVLDIEKRQVRLIGTQGSNRLAHPVDVSVARDGMIYVADNERRAVLVYGPDERPVNTFAVDGWKPVSLDVHGDRLYVCDLERQRVLILDRRSGSVLGEFGKAGGEPGDFRVPIGVDTDRDGFVYVSDMMQARVQKFTPDGAYLTAFGELGDYAGSFARPKQLAVDEDGIIYVVDAAFQNVQMFNDEFALLMSFGSAGTYPGAMNLPVGISVTGEGVETFADLFHPGFEPDRVIAVTNQFGPQKVSIYALGRRQEGWTVAELHRTSGADAGVGRNEQLTVLQSVEEGQALPSGAPAETPAAGPAEGEGR